jgi:cytochrome c oxidase subunit 2
MLKRSTRIVERGAGHRMQALAIPWQSRGFWLSLVGSVLLGLFLLATQGVGAQAALPEAVSSQGDDIRTLYFVVFGIGFAVFIIVEIMIVFVAIRYRRRSPDELPPQIHGSVPAEIAWTAIPLMMVIGLFVYSFIVLEDVTSGADEGEASIQVDVRSQQWAWDFFYSEPIGTSSVSVLTEHLDDVELEVADVDMIRPLLSLPAPLRVIRIDQEHLLVQEINGNTLTVQRQANGTVSQTHFRDAPIYWVFSGREFRRETRLADGQETIGVPVLTVPTDIKIRFNILSIDVLHAFYTPQFLFKIDAVPGRLNTMWVNVTEAGIYESQCAEFCGLNHARMLFTVVALEPDDFDLWLAETANAKRPGEAPPPSDDDADDTPADGPATNEPNAARGQELFFANGCSVCHGDNGEGGIGPTIASTGFSLDQVIGQYRSPRDAMPAFPADRVSDAEVADIYAWLQTLPLPDTIVPGEGTP